MAAMLLEVLGVDAETIARRTTCSRTRRSRGYCGGSRQCSPMRHQRRSRWLLSLSRCRGSGIRCSREYGGAEAYLRTHGLTDATFDSLLRNLLE